MCSNTANSVHRFPRREARLPEKIVSLQTSSLGKEKQLAVGQGTVSLIAPCQVPRWRASAGLTGKFRFFHGLGPASNPQASLAHWHDGIEPEAPSRQNRAPALLQLCHHRYLRNMLYYLAEV